MANADLRRAIAMVEEASPGEYFMIYRDESVGDYVVNSRYKSIGDLCQFWAAITKAFTDHTNAVIEQYDCEHTVKH